MRKLAIITFLMCFVFVSPVTADDDDDRNEMFDARRSGAILPLSEILNRLRPRIGDRIVEIEFEVDDGLAVYEIYFLDERGRRKEIEVDAATAEILDMEEDD